MGGFLLHKKFELIHREAQVKASSYFLMVQNRLQSEHSAYSFVEFILKCISNNFDNPETFILCQYPRADCVTFYILY